MKIDFEKSDGLVPAIIVDAVTNTVLMLGYMNEEAVRISGARFVGLSGAVAQLERALVMFFLDLQ